MCVAGQPSVCERGNADLACNGATYLEAGLVTKCYLCTQCPEVFEATEACPRCGKLGQTVFGDFEVVRQLGRGGMGVVFLAERSDSGQRRAIKLLATRYTDGTAAERFFREASVASTVQHENLAVFYDYKEFEPGRYYIESEYVEGVTLATRLREATPIKTDTAIHWAIRILDAVTELHRHDIIHRDIKPSNVVIGAATNEQSLKVIDLGLAKSLRSTEQLTIAGSIMGTVPYAAPEQLLGHDVGKPADIYSTAIVLFEMITGQYPFQAATEPARVHKSCYEDRPRLGDLNPNVEVPTGIEALLLTALSIYADARPTAPDFARGLRVVLANQRAALAEAPTSRLVDNLATSNRLAGTGAGATAAVPLLVATSASTPRSLSGDYDINAFIPRPRLDNAIQQGPERSRPVTSQPLRTPGLFRRPLAMGSSEQNLELVAGYTVKASPAAVAFLWEHIHYLYALAPGPIRVEQLAEHEWRGRGYLGKGYWHITRHDAGVEAGIFEYFSRGSFLGLGLHGTTVFEYKTIGSGTLSFFGRAVIKIPAHRRLLRFPIATLGRLASHYISDVGGTVAAMISAAPSLVRDRLGSEAFRLYSEFLDEEREIRAGGSGPFQHLILGASARRDRDDIGVLGDKLAELQERVTRRGRSISLREYHTSLVVFGSNPGLALVNDRRIVERIARYVHKRICGRVGAKNLSFRQLLKALSQKPSLVPDNILELMDIVARLGRDPVTTADDEQPTLNDGTEFIMSFIGTMKITEWLVGMVGEGDEELAL